MKNKSFFKWFSILFLMMIAGMTGASAQSLVIDGFSIKAGETKNMAIQLAANQSPVYGVQTDIVFSEGLSLEANASAVEGFNLMSNTVSTGAVRVSLFSTAGSIIPEGSVITLTVKASDTFERGFITLTNTRLTTSDTGDELRVADMTAVAELELVESTFTATFTTNYGWDEVYAYVWSGEDPNVTEFFGPWPGVKLTAADGGYTMTLKSFEVPEKIIFNNGALGGSLNNQTEDLIFVNGKAYEYNRVVFGMRQKPSFADFASESLVFGEQVYLYNVGADMFFTAGNDWRTRASVADEGQAVYFTVTDEALANGENVVELKNFVPSKNRFMSAFADGLESVWTDNDTHEGRFWTVTKVDDTYRVSNVLYDGYFLGFDKAKGDSRLYLLDAEQEGASVDWKFIAPHHYQAYIEALHIYNVSEELRAAIEYAKSFDINTADAEAVYANELSTIAEMTEVMNALKEAWEEYPSATNPVDVTARYIVNPSYDTNDNNGWSGSTPQFEGSQNALFYSQPFESYQYVTGLETGVYALGVQGFYRAGSLSNAYNSWLAGTNRFAEFYVENDGVRNNAPIANIYDGTGLEGLGFGTEVWLNGVEPTRYAPNNATAAQGYFDAGRYQNKLIFAIDSSNVARIGLIKNSTWSSDWTVFDNWSLTYYGNGADAYGLWLNDALKDFYDFSNLEGVLYTESYLNAYNEAVATTVTSKDEANAVIQSAKNAGADLQLNINLWEELKNVVSEAIEVGADGDLDPNYTGPLAEWAEFDAPKILDAHELTNEVLEALIVDKKAEIAEARKHPARPGADVTNMLTNPNFQQEEEGWTGFRTTTTGGAQMPTTGGPAANRCAEAWNTKEFDLYQVVENAPVGVYEISVQGFYRYGRGDNAWNIYNAQEVDEVKPGGAPCYVYMNTKATPFQNVFDEPVAVAEDFYSTQRYTDPNGEYVFPDGMISAGEAYSRGMYTQRAYGLVAKEGDVMRIGVKGNSSQLNDSWCIFDNFKLTWWGFDKTDVIKPVLDEELTKAQANVSKLMGKSAYEHLTVAIATAENTTAGTDGKDMFDALSALFDVDSEITESVKAFKVLQSKLDELNDELAIHSASTAANEAVALLDEISRNLENHAYEETDIAGLLDQIKEMITKLRIPAGTATFKNPIDFTAVITNPSYDENLNGWTCEAKNNSGYESKPYLNLDACNVELFNTNYDYYQELTGLPAGIYRITVNGFYRAGDAYNEWDLKDDKSYNYAHLYAVGEDGEEWSKDLARESQHSIESAERLSGYYVVQADVIDSDNGLYNYKMLANTMVTAGDMFAQGYYGGDAITGKGNVVTVKVGADGKLRFGLKKSEMYDRDWTIWDDWHLWYLGEGEMPPAGMLGDVNGDEQVNVTDAVMTIDYILQKHPANFQEPFADVNADGLINVTDVVTIIDAILEKVALSRGAEPVDDSHVGVLSMLRQLNLVAGDAVRVPVSLENHTAYNAFQMDVTVPAGITLKNVELTDRAADSHQVLFNKLSEGQYRVLCLSMENEAFRGEQGDLLYLNLASDGSDVQSSVTVDNVLFVTTTGIGHQLNGVEAFGQTTGISQMENGQWIMDNTYDLQGRKVNSQKKKGLYIVNGKKSIIK